jgi:hypothetical protein
MVKSGHYSMFTFSVRLEIPFSYETSNSFTEFTKIRPLTMSGEFNNFLHDIFSEIYRNFIVKFFFACNFATNTL